jgi:hypothetical protein
MAAHGDEAAGGRNGGTARGQMATPSVASASHSRRDHVTHAELLLEGVDGAEPYWLGAGQRLLQG